MRRNALGERMKEYEQVAEVRLTRRLPMVVRLDGKRSIPGRRRLAACVRLTMR